MHDHVRWTGCDAVVWREQGGALQLPRGCGWPRAMSPAHENCLRVARYPDGAQRMIALLAQARPPGKAPDVRRGNSQGALRRAAGAGSKAPWTGRTPANSAHGVMGRRTGALATATTRWDPSESTPVRRFKNAAAVKTRAVRRDASK